MDKAELKRHLEAVESYINTADRGLRCAYNRLKLIQEFVAMDDEEFSTLLGRTVDVQISKEDHTDER